MTCEDMLRLLGEYVDAEIDPALCAEFERHLAGCDPCKVVVDNIRRTITLYKGEEVYELPAGFHDRLHQALRKRWTETGPGGAA
jgi:anti-sigma factor RsiW